MQRTLKVKICVCLAKHGSWRFGVSLPSERAASESVNGCQGKVKAKRGLAWWCQWHVKVLLWRGVKKYATNDPRQVQLGSGGAMWLKASHLPRRAAKAEMSVQSEVLKRCGGCSEISFPSGRAIQKNGTMSDSNMQQSCKGGSRERSLQQGRCKKALHSGAQDSECAKEIRRVSPRRPNVRRRQRGNSGGKATSQSAKREVITNVTNGIQRQRITNAKALAKRGNIGGIFDGRCGLEPRRRRVTRDRDIVPNASSVKRQTSRGRLTPTTLVTAVALNDGHKVPRKTTLVVCAKRKRKASKGAKRCELIKAVLLTVLRDLSCG